MYDTSINLKGMSIKALEQLHTALACDFFSDISEEQRDTISAEIDRVKTCFPHSFVLASLFDVEAMISDIPEHVYEADPTLEWVCCPSCDGEKWVDTGSNTWTSALFSDVLRAYAYRHLNSSYKVCGRCSGSGEVLDDLSTNKNENIPTPFPPKLQKPLELVFQMAA